MNVDAPMRRVSPAALWSVAFVVAMFGAGAGARWFGLSGWATMVAMVPPMLLLIPMTRAVERDRRDRGEGSAAAARYGRRMMVISFAYVAALFLAIGVFNALAPEDRHGALPWALAALPALPVFAMIAAMARYLIEETDEYLRTRQIGAALVATGLLLGVATAWGFLETFGAAPHVPGWMAMPVWAIGLAVGALLNRRSAA